MGNDRIVALQIQLKGVQTIEQLETVLKDINKELKQTDVNSQAYQKLSAAAVEASGKLAGLKENLKGISESKAAEKQAKEIEKLNALYIRQADSISKIAGGLAAGLSVATITSSHFGEQTAESIQKGIKTAQELSVVLQSIKPITEALSGENLKLASGFIDGFKKSGVAAKLFGNTAKTAIASTGIGLLVVGLGLLIANWESVTKAVRGFIDTVPFLSNIGKVIDGISQKVGSLGNLFSSLGSSITALLKFEDPIKAFNDSLANGIVVENLQKQVDTLENVNGKIDNQIKLLEAQKNKESEVFQLKKQRYENEITLLAQLKSANGELSTAQEKQLQDAILGLELLTIAQDNFHKEKSDALKKESEERAKALQKEKEERKKAAQANADATAAEIDEIVRQRIQAEIQAEREIQDLKLGLRKNGLDKELIQLDLLFKDKLSKLVGNETQITEQTKLLEEQRNREIIKIREKFRQSEVKTKQDKIAEDNELDLENLQAFFEQAGPLISEFSNTIADAFSTSISNNIDRINAQIESVDQKYQSSIQEREALESQLANSQGVMREQILASIDEERQKQKQLEQEKKNLTNARIKQENKNREIQWANALIQSVMQTAQAILAALTTVPPASFAFAAATAALAGIQTAVVAAQKPKAAPLLAAEGGQFNGGYTGRGTVRDKTGERKGPLLQLHADEWAFVAPKWQVQDPVYGRMIQQLEAARQNRTIGMAEGGISNITSPSIGITSINDNSSAIIADAISRMKPEVSVVEISNQQNRVQVISEKASL